MGDDSWDSWDALPIEEQGHIDACIEDTVHCQLCRASLLCGDNDLVLDENLCLCAECCERVQQAYQRHLHRLYAMLDR